MADLGTAGLVLELQNFDAFQEGFRVLDRILDEIDNRLDSVGSGLNTLEALFNANTRASANLQSSLTVLGADFGSLTSQIYETTSALEQFTNLSTHVNVLEEALSRLWVSFATGDAERARELFLALATAIQTLASSMAELNIIAETLERFRDVLISIAPIRGPTVAFFDDLASAIANLLSTAINLDSTSEYINRFADSLRAAASLDTFTIALDNLALSFAGLASDVTSVESLTKFTNALRKFFELIKESPSAAVLGQHAIQQLLAALEPLKTFFSDTSSINAIISFAKRFTDFLQTLATAPSVVSLIEPAIRELLNALVPLKAFFADTASVTAISRFIVVYRALIETFKTSASATANVPVAIRELLHALEPLGTFFGSSSGTISNISRFLNAYRQLLTTLTTSASSIGDVKVAVDTLIVALTPLTTITNTSGIDANRKFVTAFSGLLSVLASSPAVITNAARAIRLFLIELEPLGRVVAGIVSANALTKFVNSFTALLRVLESTPAIVVPAVAAISAVIRALEGFNGLTIDTRVVNSLSRVLSALRETMQYFGSLRLASASPAALIPPELEATLLDLRRVISLISDALAQFQELRRPARLRAAATVINAIRTIIHQVSELSSAGAGGAANFERIILLIGQLGPLVRMFNTFATELSQIRRAPNVRAASGVIRAIGEFLGVINELNATVGINAQTGIQRILGTGGILELLPNLKGLTKAIAKSLTAFQEIKEPRLLRVATDTIKAIGQFLTAIGTVFDDVFVQRGNRLASAILGGVRLTDEISALPKLFQVIVKSVNQFKSLKVDTSKIDFGSLGRFFEGVARLLPQIENVGALRGFKRQSLTQVVPVIAKLAKEMAKIGRQIDEADAVKAKALAEALNNISTALQKFSNIDITENVGEKLRVAIKQLGPDITSGFKDGTKDVKRAGEQVGTSFVGGVKKALRISSPSRVMIEVGKDIIAGLRLGIQAGQLVVEATVAATQFTAMFVKAAIDGWRKFGNSMWRVFRETAEAGVETFRQTARQITQTADTLIQQGLQRITAGGIVGFLQGQAVSMVANFDAIITQIGVYGKVAGSQLDAIKSAILDFSVTAGFGPSQIADAFLGLQKAGLEVGAALDTLPAISDLATAAQLDLAGATDLAIQTMAGFGLQFTDITEIANAFVGAADISTAAVGDLASAIGFVGPGANALGISIQQVSAAVALLNDRAITGERAGTGLRAILASLAAPTDDAAVTLNKLGIKLADAEGNFVGLDNVIAQFQVAIEKLRKSGAGNVEIIGQLSSLGDRNAISALLSLIDEGSGAMITLADGTTRAATAFDEYLLALDDANTSSEVSAAIMQNFKGSVVTLKGAIDALIITALSPLLNDVLRPMVEELTVVVQRIKNLPQPILSGAAAAIAMFTAFVTLSGVMRLFAGIMLRQLGPALQFVGLGLKFVQLSLFSPAKITIAFARFALVIGTLIPILIALAAVVGSLITIFAVLRHVIQNDIGGAGESFAALMGEIKSVIGEVVAIARNLADVLVYIYQSFIQSTTESKAFNTSLEVIGGAISKFIDGLRESLSLLRNSLAEIRAFTDFVADVVGTKREDAAEKRRKEALEDAKRARADLELERAQLLAARDELTSALDDPSASDVSGKIIVKAGESLDLYAERYNVTVDEIIRLNDKLKNRKDEIIFTGEEIVIPGIGRASDVQAEIDKIDSRLTELNTELSTSATTTENPYAIRRQEILRQLREIEEFTQRGGAAGVYKIQWGDTLDEIAARFGVTKDEIIAANKDIINDPNLIFAGDNLVIPGAGSAVEEIDEARRATEELRLELEKINEADSLNRKLGIDETNAGLSVAVDETSRLADTFSTFAQTGLFKRLFGEIDPNAPNGPSAVLNQLQAEVDITTRRFARLQYAVLLIAQGDTARGLELIQKALGQTAAQYLNFFEAVFNVNVPDKLIELLKVGDFGGIFETIAQKLQRRFIDTVTKYIDNIAEFVGDRYRFLFGDIQLRVIDFIFSRIGISGVREAALPLVNFIADVLTEVTRAGLNVLVGRNTVVSTIANGIFAIFQSAIKRAGEILIGENTLYDTLVEVLNYVGLGPIISKIYDIIAGAATGINDAMRDVIGFGVDDIVTSIGDGIVSAADTLATAGYKLGEKLVTGFKDFLGISSPSKKFIELAEDIIDGLVVGLKSAGKSVVNVFSRLFRSATQTVRNAFNKDIITAVRSSLDSVLALTLNLFSQLTATVFNFGANIVTTLVRRLRQLPVEISLAIAESVAAIILLFDVFGGPELVSEAVSAAQNFGNAFISTLLDILGQIPTAFGSLFDFGGQVTGIDIAGTFAPIETLFKQFFPTTKDDLEALNPAIDNVRDSFGLLGDSLSELWSVISDIGTPIVDFFRDLLSFNLFGGGADDGAIATGDSAIVPGVGRVSDAKRVPILIQGIVIALNGLATAVRFVALSISSFAGFLRAIQTMTAFATALNIVGFSIKAIGFVLQTTFSLIGPILEDIIGLFTAFVTAITEMVKRGDLIDFLSGIGIAFGALFAVFIGTAPVIAATTTAVLTFAGVVASLAATIVSLIATVGLWLAYGTLILAAINILKRAFDPLFEIIAGLGAVANAIISAIIETLAAFFNLLRGQYSLREFIGELDNIFDTAEQSILNGLTKIFKGVDRLVGAVLAGVLDTVATLVQVIGRGLNALGKLFGLGEIVSQDSLDAFQNFTRIIGDILSDKGILFFAVRIGELLFNGLRFAYRAIDAAITGIFDRIRTAIDRAIGSSAAFISRSFVTLAFGIVRALSTAFDFVSKSPQLLLALGGQFISVITGAISLAIDALPNVLNVIGKAFVKLLSGLPGLISGAIRQISSLIRDIGDDFESLTGIDISRFTDGLADFIDLLASFIDIAGAFATGVLNSLVDAFTGLLDGFLDLATSSTVLDFIKGLFTLDPDTIATALGGFKSALQLALSAVLGAIFSIGELLGLDIDADPAQIAASVLDMLFAPLNALTKGDVSGALSAFKDNLTQGLSTILSGVFSIANLLPGIDLDAADANQVAQDLINTLFAPLEALTSGDFTIPGVSQISQLFSDLLTLTLPDLPDLSDFTDFIEKITGLDGVEVPDISKFVADIAAIVIPVLPDFSVIETGVGTAISAVTRFFDSISKGGNRARAFFEGIAISIEIFVLNFKIGILGLLDSVLLGFIGVVNTAVDKINDVIDDFPDFFGIKRIGRIEIESPITAAIEDAQTRLDELQQRQIELDADIEVQTNASEIQSQVDAAISDGNLDISIPTILNPANADVELDQEQIDAFREQLAASIGVVDDAVWFKANARLNVEQLQIADPTEVEAAAGEVLDDLSFGNLTFSDVLTFLPSEDVELLLEPDVLQSALNRAFESSDSEELVGNLALQAINLSIATGAELDFNELGLTPEQLAGIESYMQDSLDSVLTGEQAPQFTVPIGNAVVEFAEQGLFSINDEQLTQLLGIIQEQGLNLGEDNPILLAANAMGLSIADGIIGGLDESGPDLNAAAFDAFQQINAGFTGPEAADSQSPSRWAMGVAKDLIDGLVIGLNDNIYSVVRKVGDIMFIIKTLEDSVVDFELTTSAEMPIAATAFELAALRIVTASQLIIDALLLVNGAASVTAATLGGISAPVAPAAQQPPFGGGRAEGGPVQQGVLYEVNEPQHGVNRSEVFITRGGRQYLLPGESGSVRPLQQAPNNATIQQTVNVVVTNPASGIDIESAVERALQNANRSNPFLSRARMKGKL